MNPQWPVALDLLLGEEQELMDWVLLYHKVVYNLGNFNNEQLFEKISKMFELDW